MVENITFFSVVINFFLRPLGYEYVPTPGKRPGFRGPLRAVLIGAAVLSCSPADAPKPAYIDPLEQFDATERNLTAVRDAQASLADLKTYIALDGERTQTVRDALSVLIERASVLRQLSGLPIASTLDAIDARLNTPRNITVAELSLLMQQLSVLESAFLIVQDQALNRLTIADYLHHQPQQTEICPATQEHRERERTRDTKQATTERRDTPKKTIAQKTHVDFIHAVVEGKTSILAELQRIRDAGFVSYGPLDEMIRDLLPAGHRPWVLPRGASRAQKRALDELYKKYDGYPLSQLLLAKEVAEEFGKIAHEHHLLRRASGLTTARQFVGNTPQTKLAQAFDAIDNVHRVENERLQIETREDIRYTFSNGISLELPTGLPPAVVDEEAIVPIEGVLDAMQQRLKEGI